MKCEKCGKEHDSSYGSGRFCSKECARSFSTSKEIRTTKNVNCIQCGKELEVDKRASSKLCKCEECKKRNRKKKCSICGQYKCLRKDICKKYQLFPTLIKYFGFDENVIGTIGIYKEFERIKTILYNEYIDCRLSSMELAEKYNYKWKHCFTNILKGLNIPIRNKSDSNKNTILMGRRKLPNNYKYKCGWHTSWNGKKYFYRSGYELDYCKELDDKKIDYEMESLRFLYWDSQQQKERVAIPDFHIIDEHLIVEIKSDYTYDEQNMKDKVKEYKKHGYDFKLILEHEEMIL